MVRPKTFTRRNQLGQQGVNLIERIVLDMGSRWSPEILDVGIDGIIELCDPATREALGLIVQVQSKATAGRFDGESDSQLTYTCDQRDLDYWLRSNTPVILVVSRPSTREAYWVSIPDYFADPARRESRRITFSKTLDRFDAGAWPALHRLAVRREQLTGPQFLERAAARLHRRLTSSGLYLAILLALVLPVASGSCNGSGGHAGATLSSATYIRGLFDHGPFDADPDGLLNATRVWAAVTVLLPVAGLAVNLVGRPAASRLAAIAPVLIGCAGILVVLAMLAVMVQHNAVDDQPQVRTPVEPAVGFWVETAAFLATAGLGALWWRGRELRPPARSAASAPSGRRS